MCGSQEAMKHGAEEVEEQPRKRMKMEPKLIRRPLSKSQVMAMIDLYKSMGDLKSARELYLQELAYEVINSWFLFFHLLWKLQSPALVDTS